MKAADQPWLRPPRRRWRPLEMTRPPLLNPATVTGPVEPRYALLINPFYPKAPNASFGKHVLTPTLALSSFAATTPEHWQLQYWDENLLDGRPPFAPMPEVVGITVHLTFARRAFELAQWYRSRGSKVVCWAACTCFPVPKSVRRTRTRLRWAMACSFGRVFWRTWRRGAYGPATRH